MKYVFTNGKATEISSNAYNEYRFDSAAVDLTEDNYAKNFSSSLSPLFMYLALQSPHAPMQTMQRYFDLYPNIIYAS